MNWGYQLQETAHVQFTLQLKNIDSSLVFFWLYNPVNWRFHQWIDHSLWNVFRIRSYANKLSQSLICCSFVRYVPVKVRGHVCLIMRLYEEDEACKLTDTFAVTVQILMATLALCSLLYKRSLERPRRPLLVWYRRLMQDHGHEQASDISITRPLCQHLLGVHIFPLAPEFFKSLRLVFPQLADGYICTTIGVYLLYIALNIVNAGAQPL